jgi:putative restriction endonuclease
MMRVQPGDIIFSYADTTIKGIGVALSSAQTFEIPDEFVEMGNNWANFGWHLDVSFAKLQTPLRTIDRIEEIRPLLPSYNSPIQENGNAVLGYLSEVPEPLANKLLELLGEDFHNSYLLAGGDYIQLDVQGDLAEEELEKRLDLQLLEKHQLIKARRGQGKFKSNVRAIEKSCRVTKLALPQHLIASHIKPWADSNDREKLDGNNGFLLSPHIDHLFDRGFMTFRNNGEVLWSPKLQHRVLKTWHLDYDINVGSFNSEQKKYLEFHRDVKLLAG